MGTCMTVGCVGDKYGDSVWCIQCNVAQAVMDSDPPEERGD